MNSSKTISAIIIEDEPKSAAVLKNLLHEYCPVIKLAGIAGDIRTAAALIEQNKPDVLFLDIEIGNNTAFDLLNEWPHISCHIIFTTAYSQYAIKAIKQHAFDYLLKPIQPEDLVEAVDKLQQAMQKVVIPGDLLKNIKDAVNVQPAKLVVPVAGGMIFIDAEEISFLRAEGSYTCIYTTGKEKVIASKNIREFEDLLPAGFFRIHRSYIVNLHYVARYVQGRGGYVVLKNGEELEVAARKKDEFLRLFHH